MHKNTLRKHNPRIRTFQPQPQPYFNYSIQQISHHDYNARLQKKKYGGQIKQRTFLGLEGSDLENENNQYRKQMQEKQQQGKKQVTKQYNASSTAIIRTTKRPSIFSAHRRTMCLNKEIKQRQPVKINTRDAKLHSGLLLNEILETDSPPRTNKKTKTGDYQRNIRPSITNKQKQNRSSRHPNSKNKTVTPTSSLQNPTKIQRTGVKNWTLANPYNVDYQPVNTKHEIDFFAYSTWRKIHYEPTLKQKQSSSIQIITNQSPQPNNIITIAPKISESVPYDQIMSIFGPHHSLMKPNSDYLLRLGRKCRSEWNGLAGSARLGVSSKKRKQQKIEIKQAHRPKPKKLKKVNINNYPVTPYYNPSTIQQNNQRAPILTYIKINPSQNNRQTISCPNTNESELQSKQFDKARIFIDPKTHTQFFETTIRPLNEYQVIYMKSQSQSQSKQVTTKNCLQFLQLLYKIQPDILVRLFDPQYSPQSNNNNNNNNNENMFQVWLFINGGFDLVQLHGYFELEGLQEGMPLWLVVLTKSMDKVARQYGLSWLQIGVSEVYKLLTGTDLYTIPHSSIMEKSTIEFTALVTKYLNKKHTVILKNENTENLSILALNPSQKSHQSSSQHQEQHNFEYSTHQNPKTPSLLHFNPLTNNTLSPLNLNTRLLSSLYILPHYCNWYIYTYMVPWKGTSQFEISCVEEVEIIGSVGWESGEGEVLVYQLVGGQGDQARKLKLRTSKRFKSTVKIKIKAGRHIIYYQNHNNKQFLPQNSSQLSSESQSQPPKTPKINPNTYSNHYQNKKPKQSTNHKLSFLTNYEISLIQNSHPFKNSFLSKYHNKINKTYEDSDQ